MSRTLNTDKNPQVWNAIKARLKSLRLRGIIEFKRDVGWTLIKKAKEEGTSPPPETSTKDTKTQRILHLQAGSDTWTPTSEELQELVNMFQHNVLPDKLGGIVASPEGLCLRVRQYEVCGDEKVIASTGDLSDEDIRQCVKAYNTAGVLRQGLAVEAFRRKLQERRSK